MISLRHVSRVTTPREYPGDSQVNAKKLILPMGQYQLTDPFIMLAEDWFDSSGGFETHPHRGFETVTFALEGSIRHKDSKGNEGRLGSGDVQWMTAGRGIMHSEIAEGTEQVHSLQLWLNLPREKKMVEPRYQDIPSASIPSEKVDGGEVRVISGAFGNTRSSTKNHHPVTLLEVKLQDSAELSIPLPADQRAFMYLLDGAAQVSGSDVESGKVAWFDPVDQDGDIVIKAKGDLRLLLFAGKPINETIVQYGPFVMNTREEIMQAFEDIQSGRFGD
jgi:quercetin 2,3-dioxygenase